MRLGSWGQALIKKRCNPQLEKPKLTNDFPSKNAAWSLKKPSRADVIFDELLNGTIPRQPIYMDEEIAPPITIAMIEDYSGPDEPFIEFLSGKNSTLELTAQLDGLEWSLVVTKQQDYEQISMRAYRIQITIGDQTVWILLNINNIFDNAPVITSNSIPCIAEVRLQKPFH